jgi:hypothetical protein
LILAVRFGCQFVSAQETARLDKTRRAKLQRIAVELTSAQNSEDETEIQRLAKNASEVRGDQADHD